MNGTIYNDPAMWENSGGGFGYCSTWEALENCEGYSSDLMFDLQGKTKKE
ncbi:MAG TPA: hypothetical protein VMF67_06195 [Rhizomicrobium sp.]|nr:hypothetical protein [Rhizomicrobium sp.]